MSAVIKSGSSASVSVVQSLNQAVAVAPVVSLKRYDEERDVLLRRIAGLEEDLRQRDAQASAMLADATREQEEGNERSYEAGLMAAQDRQSERLGLLEKSMLRAHDSLSESMTALPRLSAILAQECLDIILGDARDRGDFLRKIIAEQIGKIDREMLIGIQLSRLDFPKETEILELAGQLNLPSVNISAHDELVSGACHMTLRLGRISVGLNQQWPTLRRLLDEMALPQEAP